MYKDGTGVQGQEVSRQLLHCCDSDLMDIVLRSNSTVAAKVEKDVLEAIKTLDVIPIAIGARRADMLAMTQLAGEPTRAFAARIQGKATTCAYTLKCTKNTTVCNE